MKSFEELGEMWKNVEKFLDGIDLKHCPRCGARLTAARQGSRIVPDVFCIPCHEKGEDL